MTPLGYIRHPTRSSLCRGAQSASGLDPPARWYNLGGSRWFLGLGLQSCRLGATSIAILIKRRDSEIEERTVVLSPDIMGTDDIENQPKVAKVDTESLPSKSHVEAGRENLHHAIRPHQSYEGGHRWDPYVTWTPEEERKAVRKTDLMLLSWLCVMVRSSIQRVPRLISVNTGSVLRPSTRSRQSVQRISGYLPGGLESHK